MPVIIHDLRARIRGVQSSAMGVQANLRRILTANNIPEEAIEDLYQADFFLREALSQLKLALEYIPVFEGEAENEETEHKNRVAG